MDTAALSGASSPQPSRAYGPPQRLGPGLLLWPPATNGPVMDQAAVQPLPAPPVEPELAQHEATGEEPPVEPSRPSSVMILPVPPASGPELAPRRAQTREPAARLNTTPVMIKPREPSQLLESPLHVPPSLDSPEALPDEPSKPITADSDVKGTQPPTAKPTGSTWLAPDAAAVTGDLQEVTAAYMQLRAAHGRVCRPDLRSLLARRAGCEAQQDGTWPTTEEIIRLLREAGDTIDLALATGVLAEQVDHDGATVLRVIEEV